MRLKLVSTAAVTMLAASVIATPAYAAHFDGQPETVWGCTYLGITGDLIPDRDNTGLDIERYTTLITDGVGNTIYGPFEQVDLIGSTSTRVASVIQFASFPVANPLTFTVTSNAGNGLDEELILRDTGSCSGIPSPAVVTPADFTSVVGDTVTVALFDFAIEPNGFALTYQLYTVPSIVGMELSPDGTLTYEANIVGTETFIVNVKNSAGQIVEMPVTITVTEAKAEVDPPAVTPAATPATDTLAATGSEGLANLTLMGIAAAALGLLLMRPRRRS